MVVIEYIIQKLILIFYDFIRLLFLVITKEIPEIFDSLFIFLLLLIGVIWVLRKYDKNRFKINSDKINENIKNEHLSIYSQEKNLFEEYFNNKITEIKSLINNGNYNQLNLALDGRFGSGKSTIINLLLNVLLNDNDLKEFDVLKLNVLSFYKTEQFIENLIRELCIKFNYKFYESLIKVYSSATLNSGFLNIEFLIDDKVPYENRIAHFKNHVYRTLKKQDKKQKQEKKFLLVLDEFDRIIDKEVLLNALKFIHIFSRIPNVYLIATVDYENFQEIFGKEYYIVNLLEKVFDYRIDIEVPKYSLRDIFIDEIEKILNENQFLFQANSEKTIVLEKIKELKMHTYIFTFNTIRELKKPLESIKSIINGDLRYLAEEIWFVDLIIIEWLKVKHPFVWHIIKNNYILLANENDVEKEIFQKVLPGKTDKDHLIKSNQFIEKEKIISELKSRIFDEINKIINNNMEYIAVSSALAYLINIEWEGGFLGNDFKKITGIDSTFLAESNPYPRGNESKDEFSKNLVYFKRLFRLHNIKLYLGVRQYLYKFDDFYKVLNINDCLEKVHKDEMFPDFKEKIISSYISEVYPIKDGFLKGFDNDFWEEILTKIISYYNSKCSDRIFEIYNCMKEKVKKDQNIDDENKKEMLDRIYKILKNLKEINQYHQ